MKSIQSFTCHSEYISGSLLDIYSTTVELIGRIIYVYSKNNYRDCFDWDRATTTVSNGNVNNNSNNSSNSSKGSDDDNYTIDNLNNRALSVSI